jgi:hypothetical protein
MHSSVTLSPVDQVGERLNDPAVAASIVTLLDHAELLSTLVSGLSAFLERGDTIVESLASGVAEMKAAAPSAVAHDFGQTLGEARSAMVELSQALPVLRQVLNSGMVNQEVINLLAIVSESAVEGAEVARTQHTTVKGARGALKALKDPQVQHGLGLLIEISRSLGRRMAAN